MTSFTHYKYGVYKYVFVIAGFCFFLCRVSSSYFSESFVLYSDGFASNIKKTEPVMNKDSQALLKQVALTDLLGGWKDGILTIGTLGYDPLKSINHNKEYFALEAEHNGQGEGDQVEHNDEENCYNAEHEENPLMHTTFEHKFEDVVCENHDANASSKEEVVRTFSEIVEVPIVIPNEVMESNEIVEVPLVITNEVMESNNVETDQKKMKGERITLADLFLADSDVKMKLHPAKVFHESSEKPKLKTKHGLSFAKKIIPRVKDNAYPMKDIKKVSHFLTP